MDGEFLTKTVLFQGTTPQEAEQMLSCLGAQRRVFPKGAYVYRAGEPVRALGVVLSGLSLIHILNGWRRICTSIRIHVRLWAARRLQASW